MAKNACEGCSRNCCIDFRITTEPTNPEVVRETLRSFPFIRKTDSVLVLSSGGHERVIGVYNCGRFDREAGTCRDYDTQPRPSFCLNAGKMVAPHGRCLLKLENR